MTTSDFGDSSTSGSRFGAPQNRVDRILHDLLEMAHNTLLGQIATLFEQANDDLFKRAEKAVANDAQQHLFESMREIKRRRVEFDLNFNNLLRDSFIGLPERAKRFRADPGVDAARDRSKTKSKLSLVNNTDLEESLALDELVAKAEIKQSQALWALAQRFGVLAGSSALDLSLIPAGPQALAQILRQSAQVFDMPVASKVMLYRFFDREVMGNLADLLEAMNAQLARAKILPNLSFEAQRAEPAAASKPAEEPSVPEASAPLKGDAPSGNMPARSPGPAAGFARRVESETGGASIPAASPTAPVSSPSVITAAEALQAVASALGNSVRSNSSTAPAAGVARAPFSLPGGLGELIAPRNGSTADSGLTSRDAELFDTMRELLGGRRRAMASFGRTMDAPSGPSRSVSGEDVQSVLSVLQTKPQTINVGGRQVPRTISHIKQEMNQALRSLDPEGRAPQLSDLDSDTFDLVGMLFDFVLKDIGRDGVTHNMLSRLQVPVLKVALKDKSFFTQRKHPARAFLNAIAEAGQLWAEHDDGDTQLVENMQILVERALEEYDQDTTVFDTLLGDLSKHINVLTRKADVSERRHVDASKGRERLDLAKHQAQQAVEKLVTARQPPKMVQQLLEQAWADVLSLLNLRNGEDSAEYKEALLTADQVIDSVTPNQGAERRRALRGGTRTLNQKIERGLSQVGFAEAEAQTLIKNLEECQSWALAEGLPQPVPQQLLKPIPVAKTRLGKDSDDANKKEFAKVPAVPLTPEEAAMLDRIKHIPFGTWFDFVVNQQGVKARRKLSWFSPVSSKCLFVNARGMKVDERSMESLARDMVRGVALIVDETQGSMIDRAFGTIMRTLKQLTQRPQTAPAA